MTTYRLLLVKNDNDLSWVSILRESMLELAEITVLKETELSREIWNTKYDLILINTVSIPDVVKVVQRFKNKKPEVPIVILTASPNPEIARKVFLAGAADYIYQSVDKAEIRNDLLAIVKLARQNNRGPYGKANHPARR